MDIPKINDIKSLQVFIPAKKETVIGGLEFLDEYIIRGEKSDAISRYYNFREGDVIKIERPSLGNKVHVVYRYIISLSVKNR